MKVPIADDDRVLTRLATAGLGTGFEVVKKLRQSSRTEQIPVVVVSGSITEGDEARATALGAVVFLRKPVDAQKLHETLSSAAGPAG